MTAIPLFFQIGDNAILIVGGGNSAYIKLRTMLQFTNRIRMVAVDFSEKTIQLGEQNQVVMQRRPFLPEDLHGIGLVFAAAEKSINDSVHQEAKKAGVLCCKAEGGGDFLLPACKKKGSLTVAASTDGKFPMLAKKICQEMDLSLADQLDDFEKYRRYLLDRYPDRHIARQWLSEIAEHAGDTSKLSEILERIGYENH